MAFVDMPALKKGEVNLGVIYFIVQMLKRGTYHGFRLLLWPFSSMAGWLLVQTVAQPPAATLQIVSQTNSPTFMTGSTAVVQDQQQTLRLSLTSSITISKCMRAFTFSLPQEDSHSLTVHPSQSSGDLPSVHTAASLFNKMCYENKDQLMAGIIVAGWDKEVGPSVYNIPVGGGIFRQPWAIGGMYLFIWDFISPAF